jgi:hypothetical protein
MLMQMRDVAKNFDLVLAEVLRLRGPNDEGIGSVSALSARCWDQLQEVF